MAQQSIKDQRKGTKDRRKREHEGEQHQHHEEFWLDTWWPLFVILFGIIFVSVLVSFKPGIRANRCTPAIHRRFAA